MDEEEAPTNNNIRSSTPQDSSSTGSCPICLGPFLQESYLDACYHKFCYKCIVRWTKVVAGKNSRQPDSVNCPLCKREFSVIYEYDGNSVQRHYFNQNFSERSFFSKAHKYRLQCYYTEPGILNDTINVSQYWKSRKYLQPNQWLQSWSRREFQALLQEEDVDIIVHHLLGVVDSFLRRNDRKKTTKNAQEEFKALVSNAARPFLAARTDRFVNELEIFLASGLNIEAYDDVYMQKLGWDTPSVTTAAAAGESNMQTPIIPYLYIFDEDSDEND